MSMSSRILALTSEDNPEYQKHKKVLLACMEAEVSLPTETAEYFGEPGPEEYLLAEKLSVPLTEGVHYVNYHADSQSGFEVELSKLPKGISKLRFVNSW